MARLRPLYHHRLWCAVCELDDAASLSVRSTVLRQPFLRRILSRPLSASPPSSLPAPRTAVAAVATTDGAATGAADLPAKGDERLGGIFKMAANT